MDEITLVKIALTASVVLIPVATYIITEMIFRKFYKNKKRGAFE
jgi:hypothetical protein